jgi:hypothetical protein
LREEGSLFHTSFIHFLGFLGIGLGNIDMGNAAQEHIARIQAKAFHLHLLE